MHFVLLCYCMSQFYTEIEFFFRVQKSTIIVESDEKRREEEGAEKGRYRGIESS